MNNVISFDFTPIRGYQKHDGTYSTSRIDVLYECKVRKINSFDYDEVYIDETKYKYLIDEAKKQNRIPYLFIFYKNNKVLTINLRKTTPRIGDQETNRYTMVNNDDKEISRVAYFKINNNDLNNHNTIYN